MKYQFIAEHRQEYPISIMCRVLEVAPSGFYGWLRRAPSRRSQQNTGLGERIVCIYQQNRQVYGSPRIHAVLKARGIPCGRKRVVRLMQTLGLSAQMKKRRKPTTTSNPAARFAPNHLNREFAASFPNQKWVTDTKAVETKDRLAVPGGDLGSVLAPGGWLGHGCDRRCAPG